MTALQPLSARQTIMGFVGSKADDQARPHQPSEAQHRQNDDKCHQSPVQVVRYGGVIYMIVGVEGAGRDGDQHIVHTEPALYEHKYPQTGQQIAQMS